MAYQIPEPLQEQVKVDATVGQAPFSASYANAALHETLLGQLGSTIAQTASNSLATKMGYNEGMNPHGDIIPPITEADRHYADAYTAQSKNVLALQINDMFSKAQTELSRSYRISPGMINDYKTQISQGTQEILQNAPTGVKQELGAQYANTIMSSSAALERRLIAQNKDDAISAMKIADKNTDTAILDTAALGNPDEAKKLYDQKVAQNKKQRAAGMMTPLEESTSNTAAKLSYYSGVSNAKALAARNQKGEALGKYLSSLADPKNKPADLSFSEWNTIGNNTLSLMRHMDALQQTDKNLILSDLHEKLAKNGQLDPQDILTAYESPAINDTDLNEILSKMYSNKTKGNTREQKIQILTSNFSDAQVFGEQSGETVNDTYSNLVQAARTKNPELAPMEAEASIAAMAGGSIPRFLNTVANLSKSNNLNDVIAASNAYHRVQGASPQNLIGLNEDAYNFINAFDSFRQVNPGDPASALAQTRNALVSRTKEEQEAIKSNWNTIYRKKYSTPEQRSNFAREMLGINTLFNSVNVQNKAVADDHITNLLEKYMTLTGGDIETAKDMTQKAIRNVYSDTWVNGRHEVAYLSLEKIAGLDEGGTFFVQKDIASQVQNSFGVYKEAYDKGYSDFYYRIKNPEKYSIDSLKIQSIRNAKITAEIGAIDEKINALSKEGYFEGMKNDAKYQALLNERNELLGEQKIINKGFKGISSDQAAIQIEKVFRGAKGDGEVQTLNLAVIPETNTMLSYDNAQPIIGNYFIKLINENGGIENLDSISGFKSSPIYYSPNIGQIRKDYTEFHNRFGNQPSYRQQLDEYIKAKMEGKK